MNCAQFILRNFQGWNASFICQGAARPLARRIVKSTTALLACQRLFVLFSTFFKFFCEKRKDPCHMARAFQTECSVLFFFDRKISPGIRGNQPPPCKKRPSPCLILFRKGSLFARFERKASLFSCFQRSGYRWAASFSFSLP